MSAATLAFSAVYHDQSSVGLPHSEQPCMGILSYSQRYKVLDFVQLGGAGQIKIGIRGKASFYSIRVGSPQSATQLRGSDLGLLGAQQTPALG